MKNRIHELKNFYILWTTQELSQLGSAMTNFALTLWLYQKTGSALQTALLTICSYAPLVCDTLEALCTVLVYILLETGLLCAWHLYSKCIERPNEHCSEPGKQCRNYIYYA